MGNEKGTKRQPEEYPARYLHTNMALITLARATEMIPNFNTGDNAVMQDCINAASEVIVRYCNRDFVLTTYDELYDGTGDKNLLLNQYPVTQILRVSFNPINVIQIRQTDTVVSRASWRMDGTTDVPPKPNNLYLVSLKNGVETDYTIGPLVGGSIVTMNDLANQINTVGGGIGWSAQALGIYTTWPVADLRPPLGALESRWFGVSYVVLHTWNLASMDFNPDLGEIVSPLGFSFGYRNYRVVYQAGYSTVPNPIQEACAALAVSVYNSRNVNANLSQENLGGYQYQNIAEKNFHSLDIVARYGLPLFKNHRVAKFKLTL